jgi:hypothetical protein
MEAQAPRLTVYRFCIWLPMVVPAILIACAKIVDYPIARGPLVGEMLAYSLIYGGLPYAALAAWATWWIGGRPESEIRRLMVRAPLLMAAVFVPLSLVAGLLVGAPGPFAAVAVLGLVVILLFGYGYVALTMLLTWSVGYR